MFYQVRSYQDGKLVGDWLYAATNSQKALDRALRDYPAHKECLMTAKAFDEEDERKLAL